MSTTATLKPGNQLWGIYHTDREYAREMGDPLRTVVEAPTKLAAEEAAARLGFSEPWAHPVTLGEVRRPRWLPKQRRATANDSPTDPHAAFTFDYANTKDSQIRTAIEVLRKVDEHNNNNTANLVIELPDTRFGDHVAARVKVMNIEQVTRIHTVAAQLESWRDQLLQQRRQGVSNHV